MGLESSLDWLQVGTYTLRLQDCVVWVSEAPCSGCSGCHDFVLLSFMMPHINSLSNAKSTIKDPSPILPLPQHTNKSRMTETLYLHWNTPAFITSHPPVPSVDQDPTTLDSAPRPFASSPLCSQLVANLTFPSAFITVERSWPFSYRSCSREFEDPCSDDLVL